MLASAIPENLRPDPEAGPVSGFSVMRVMSHEENECVMRDRERQDQVCRSGGSETRADRARVSRRLKLAFSSSPIGASGVRELCKTCIGALSSMICM